MRPRHIALALFFLGMLLWTFVILRAPQFLHRGPVSSSSSAGNLRSASAAAALSEADRVELEHLCATSPECEDEALVQQRWRIKPGTYSRAECCKSHATMRRMLKSLSAFLDTFGFDWFVDGGTLLGPVRHGPGQLVPWDHDADIVVVVDNPQRPRHPWSITTANYYDVLLLFNSQQREFRMKPCNWNSMSMSCDTAFKVHPRNAMMSADGLWVQGAKIDVQAMMRVDDAVAPPGSPMACAGPSPCFRYLNSFWSSVGIEFAAAIVEPVAACEEVIERGKSGGGGGGGSGGGGGGGGGGGKQIARSGGNTGKTGAGDKAGGGGGWRCPQQPAAYLKQMYGDYSVPDTRKDFWNLHKSSSSSSSSQGKQVHLSESMKKVVLERARRWSVAAAAAGGGGG